MTVFSRGRSDNSHSRSKNLSVILSFCKKIVYFLSADVLHPEGLAWGFPGGYLGVWMGLSLGSPSKASPGSQCTLFINKKNT